MLYTKRAFTMIELVFVIVVIGILSAVAIPRLAVTRDDAVFVKAKSQISAIRSGIVTLKSKRLLEGTSPYPPRTLDLNTTTTDLFSGGDSGSILEYPIRSGTNDGQWEKNSTVPLPANIVYKLHLEGNTVDFTYHSSSGRFDCNTTVTLCQDLVK